MSPLELKKKNQSQIRIKCTDTKISSNDCCRACHPLVHAALGPLHAGMQAPGSCSTEPDTVDTGAENGQMGGELPTEELTECK